MKRILCTSLALLMMIILPVLTLAEGAITLYTDDYSYTICTIGMYANITRRNPELRSGPGDYFSGYGMDDWNNLRVRCLTIAVDEEHSPWVLIEVNTGYNLARGYVPLDWFDPATSFDLTGFLPHEYSYDKLTPRMLARMYISCNGYWGPGTWYDSDDYLDASTMEGTIILSDGEWALVELPEHNFPGVGWRFRKRVWIELSNLMY